MTHVSSPFYVDELPSSPDTLVVTAHFSGFSPRSLFSHWVDPTLLTRWWPQKAEIDARQGGSYHLSWPGMNWHLRGTYTAFDPGRQLAFTWRFDHESERPQEEVVITLDADGDGADLLLTHGPYPDTEEGREARRGHLQGWEHFLPKLQALAGNGKGKRA
jgi:uncharacterized protein YndB with AHSA1/START domain